MRTPDGKSAPPCPSTASLEFKSLVRLSSAAALVTIGTHTGGKCPNCSILLLFC